MIAVAELSSRDLRHAPFNAMLLRVISLAAPQETVVFHADASHCARVQELLGEVPPRLNFRPIRLSDHRSAQMTLVSLRRLWRDCVLLAGAVKQAHGQRLLLVVASASATGIWAAWLTRWLPGARARAVQFMLHGEVSALRDNWRTRHPLYRRLDLRAAMQRCHASDFRYLVLEAPVAEVLMQEVPALQGCVDAFPLPVVESEGADWHAIDLASPIELGIVGVATRAKGFDIFVRLARNLAESAPGRLRFNVVGRVHPDFAATDLTCLAAPVGFDDLRRADFVARLKRLHYVCLPFQGGYYEMGASGAVLDAITFRKPLIVLPSPMTEYLFATGGDIGHLCRDQAEMEAVLRQLASAPDAARYRRQVAAVDALYAARVPAAVAAGYRATLHGFLD